MIPLLYIPSFFGKTHQISTKKKKKTATFPTQFPYLCEICGRVRTKDILGGSERVLFKVIRSKEFDLF